ncbi:MAG TPA: response regulator [Mucilaginibacter sp.]|jgi:DNA-binding response OmpR family regulator
MGKLVVVLEDEKATLELMELALEGEGYDVMAINHHEPMEYFMDFDPQLILLDIRLTNGYGHILCEDLKSNPLTSKIPVILVSGADNLVKIAADYKADGYLSKPFNVDELINCVKQYDVLPVDQQRTFLF